jgi:decaprenylphospho-beta-D-erythro-pentofuranosid-2-ulose 2-reductase
MKRLLIVGATSAIAAECAKLWLAREPLELLLWGRDQQRLQRVAQDLRVRHPNQAIATQVVPFNDPQGIAQAVQQAWASGPIDLALIAHGSLPDQAQCQTDLDAAHQALQINGVSPCLFAEAIASHMARRGVGRLAVIGSVAGDRGRKSNYVYGAAKGMVTRHVQGLQHRLAGSGVRVTLVKPGPTDTPMTASLKLAGAKGFASVESVAQCIVAGVDAGRPVVYAPGKWALIMMVVRHLPGFVFNKMNI